MVADEVMDQPFGPGELAILSRAILGAGRGMRIRARGESMAPLLRDGDVLLVEPAPDVAVGDVALCSPRPGCLVAHRVVRRVDGPDGRRYIVQGDRLARSDGVVGGEDVLGRVVALQRAGTVVRLDQPAARLLAWLAVVRSSWPFARRISARVGRRVVMCVPALSRYLA